MNLRRLDTSAAGFEAEFSRLQLWSAETDAAIETRVAEIIADVRARGDAAVLDCTARFDGVTAASMAELEIGAPELNAALVSDADFSAWVAKRTPAGRWGEVDELVGACVFLGSAASSFVNGHVLYVDGGISVSL